MSNVTNLKIKNQGKKKTSEMVSKKRKATISLLQIITILANTAIGVAFYQKNKKIIKVIENNVQPFKVDFDS